MELLFFILLGVGVAFIISGIFLDFDFLEVLDLDLDVFSINSFTLGGSFASMGIAGFVSSRNSSWDPYWDAIIAVVVGMIALLGLGTALGSLKKRISPVDDHSFVGVLATVDISVNASSGKVLLQLPEEVSSRIAVTDDGDEIAHGEKVVVVRETDEALVVRRIPTLS